MFVVSIFLPHKYNAHWQGGCGSISRDYSQGTGEVHTPKMKQCMKEKKKLSTSSPHVSEIEIMILNRLSKFRS